MEPDGSFPCSQEPATFSVDILPPCSRRFSLITLQFTPRSYKRCFVFRRKFSLISYSSRAEIAQSVWWLGYVLGLLGNQASVLGWDKASSILQTSILVLTTHLHLVSGDNVWSYNSVTLYVFVVSCWIKHRESFESFVLTMGFLIRLKFRTVAVCIHDRSCA